MNFSKRLAICSFADPTVTFTLQRVTDKVDVFIYVLSFTDLTFAMWGIKIAKVI